MEEVTINPKDHGGISRKPTSFHSMANTFLWPPASIVQEPWASVVQSIANEKIVVDREGAPENDLDTRSR